MEECPKITKVGQPTTFMTPFDLILLFSIMVPVISLSMKFDTNIFISDRYMAILLLC